MMYWLDGDAQQFYRAPIPVTNSSHIGQPLLINLKALNLQATTFAIDAVNE
jgi:hypothetical protein